MNDLVVAVIGGLSLGATYALVSLGLVLAFRATRTFNFAHGQFMVFPAFTLGYIQGRWHMPFALQLLIALGLAAVLGLLMYALVLRRTVGLPVFLGLVATMGVASILDGVTGLMFRSNQYVLKIPGLPTGVVTILGSRFSAQLLTLSAFSLLLACVVASVLRFTPLGQRVRAAGQDPVLSSQGGINVRRVYLGSWGLAAALAGVAGISYGAATVVNPSMINLGLVAIPAMMLGGLDSIEGAIVGGLAVGVLQNATVIYLGSEYVDVVTYGLLLLVLLLIPNGLFGSKEIVRA